MHRVEPIAPVSAPSPVEALPPVERPYATHASIDTTFERYPTILDPVAASIAAAASAQDLRRFQEAALLRSWPRERRR